MAARNCLIFAVWVPPGKVHRFYDYVSLFNTHLHDFDIYIGINNDSDPHIESMTKEIKRCVYAERVAEHLTINSDASAFIKALYGLRSVGNQYEFAYFAHTKGMSYGDDICAQRNYRRDFIQHVAYLITNTSYIEKAFEDSSLGGWCRYGGIHKGDAEYSHNIETDQFTWPHLHIKPELWYSGILWLFTNYVIRFDIVRAYLEKLPESYFSTHINYRYYFEFIFPLIIDLQGYVKHIEDWCPYSWREDVGWNITNDNERPAFMIHRWRRGMIGFTRNCAKHELLHIGDERYCVLCGHRLDHNGQWVPFGK